VTSSATYLGNIKFHNKKIVLLFDLFEITLHLQSVSKIGKDMSKVCELTGKRPRVGNHVSHANNKVKRRFNPNLQKKRFYIPEEDKWVTLKVSTSALKTINKLGISAVMKDARAKGFIK
jgi:large subunit ribosomal protein L28